MSALALSPRKARVQPRWEVSDVCVSLVPRLHVGVVTDAGNSVPSCRRTVTRSTTVSVTFARARRRSKKCPTSLSKPPFRRTWMFLPARAEHSHPNTGVQLPRAERISPESARERTATSWRVGDDLAASASAGSGPTGVSSAFKPGKSARPGNGLGPPPRSGFNAISAGDGGIAADGSDGRCLPFFRKTVSMPFIEVSISVAC